MDKKPQRNPVLPIITGKNINWWIMDALDALAFTEEMATIVEKYKKSRRK